jgi:predicted nucleic acid-binding protein
MTFVADATITLAWYLREANAAAANRVRERLRSEGLCVPAHWPLEVGNGLLAAVRQGRMTLRELEQLMPDLRVLPELVDNQTDDAAWSATLELAQTYHLTTYEAAYLELVLRRDLPLATLDRHLRAAALAAGAALVPELL